MTKKFKFPPIPVDLADRYPDGDYTVGRGADPRSAAERAGDGQPSLPRLPWPNRRRSRASPMFDGARSSLRPSMPICGFRTVASGGALR